MEDQNSDNGTYLFASGPTPYSRLREPTYLRHRCQLCLGRPIFTIELSKHKDMKRGDEEWSGAKRRYPLRSLIHAPVLHVSSTRVFVGDFMHATTAYVPLLEFNAPPALGASLTAMVIAHHDLSHTLELTTDPTTLEGIYYNPLRVPSS